MSHLLKSGPEHGGVLAYAVLHVGLGLLVPGECCHEAALGSQHSAVLALLPESSVIVVLLPIAAPEEEVAWRHRPTWITRSCVLIAPLMPPTLLGRICTGSPAHPHVRLRALVP